MRFAIFQIITDLLVIYQNVSISAQKTLYPSFISKKIVALHSIGNVFLNIQFSTRFLLLLTVSEVCNVSNKYCLLNKSAKQTFLH